MKNNIHDKFFKNTLSEISRARAFLKTFLPDEVSKKLDYDSIEKTESSYVDEELEEVFSDVVFNAKLNGDRKLSISILIEHKSYKDEYTSFQVLKYISNGYSSQLKNGGEVSLIVPLIFYHGNSAWKFKGLGDFFQEYGFDVEDFIPNYRPIFIDLNLLSEKVILRIENEALRAAILAQKYSKSPDKLLGQISNIVNTFNSLKHRNFIRSIIVYIFEIVEVEGDELMEITESIKKPYKSEVMTLYQSIMEKGREQGLEQGAYREKVNAIRNGILAGNSVENLSIITGLSIDEVERIIKEN